MYVPGRETMRLFNEIGEDPEKGMLDMYRVGGVLGDRHEIEEVFGPQYTHDVHKQTLGAVGFVASMTLLAAGVVQGRPELAAMAGLATVPILDAASYYGRRALNARIQGYHEHGGGHIR